jgi:hypothetical protein
MAGRSGVRTIDKVREGMQVVDRSGKKVGRVEFVKLGDPEAITTQGQIYTDLDDLPGLIARAVVGAEPEVPEELAARLIRMGFVKVDDRGILDRDYYVAADQIDEVEDRLVRLSVDKHELLREGPN